MLIYDRYTSTFDLTDTYFAAGSYYLTLSGASPMFTLWDVTDLSNTAR